MFDEEPERDQHEQCRFEIERLESALATANARIAELKRAYDAILEDCRIQEKRIKVLEDLLNEAGIMLEHTGYKRLAMDIGAALEAK